MRKNLIWLSLLSLWAAVPAALCQVSEEPGATPGPSPAAGMQPPAEGQALADMSIPQLQELAADLRADRRFNEAVNVCRFILERDTMNVVALRMLGDIFWQMQNAELAKNSWLRVLDIQPNDFQANFGLGRLYLAQGLYRQARGYLETAEKVVPASPPEIKPQVLIALARAYQGAFYDEEALETIQRALQLAPDSFEAQYALVMLRIRIALRSSREEDLDRALIDAQKLVRLAADDLRTRGTTPQRVRTLQAAYQAELQVLQAFGQMLYERNPDGNLSDRLLPGMEKRAAAVISRTVDVMLRQADLQRTMSHFRILELAAAAVRYDGGTNPRTLLDLGLLQRQTEQWEAAAETFRKVLELDPGNDVAQRELDAIQQRLPAPAATQPPPVTP